MAVIKAVSSKAGIGHAIDYVTKKEKTEEAERRAAEEQQRIASRRYIGRDWEPER